MYLFRYTAMYVYLLLYQVKLIIKEYVNTRCMYVRTSANFAR